MGLRRATRTSTAIGLGLAVSAPATAAAQAPPELWTLSMNAQGAWSSNVDFTAVQDYTVINRYGLTLGYSRDTPRTQLVTTVAAAANQFINQQGGDRMSYSAGMDWTRQLSPRTSLQLTDSVVSAFAQSTPLLSSSGLVFPFTQTITNRASLTLSHALSPRHAISVSGRHDYVRFDSPLLTGGQQLGLTAAYQRTLSPRTNLGLGYSYLLSNVQGRLTGTDSVFGSWSQQVGPRTSISVSAGASYFRPDSSGSSQLQATGSVGLQHQGQKTSFSLQYGRSVDQAFGFGRLRVADVASANLSRPLTRNWDLQLAAGYGRSRDPFDPTFAFDAQFLSVGTAIQATRSFSIGLDYSVARRLVGTEDAQISHTAGVALAYSWQWR